MTVGDFIKQLEKFPADWRIVVSRANDDDAVYEPTFGRDNLFPAPMPKGFNHDAYESNTIVVHPSDQPPLPLC